MLLGNNYSAGRSTSSTSCGETIDQQKIVAAMPQFAAGSPTTGQQNQHQPVGWMSTDSEASSAPGVPCAVLFLPGSLHQMLLLAALLLLLLLRASQLLESSGRKAIGKMP